MDLFLLLTGENVAKIGEKKKPKNWLLEEVAAYFLGNLGATLSLVLFRA